MVRIAILLRITLSFKTFENVQNSSNLTFDLMWLQYVLQGFLARVKPCKLHYRATKRAISSCASSTQVSNHLFHCKQTSLWMVHCILYHLISRWTLNGEPWRLAKRRKQKPGHWPRRIEKENRWTIPQHRDWGQAPPLAHNVLQWEMESVSAKR